MNKHQHCIFGAEAVSQCPPAPSTWAIPPWTATPTWDKIHSAGLVLPYTKGHEICNEDGVAQLQHGKSIFRWGNPISRIPNIWKLSLEAWKISTWLNSQVPKLLTCHLGDMQKMTCNCLLAFLGLYNLPNHIARQLIYCRDKEKTILWDVKVSSRGQEEPLLF